jgi:hypothetical protein
MPSIRITINQRVKEKMEDEADKRMMTNSEYVSEALRQFFNSTNEKTGLTDSKIKIVEAPKLSGQDKKSLRSELEMMNERKLDGDDIDDDFLSCVDDVYQKLTGIKVNREELPDGYKTIIPNESDKCQMCLHNKKVKGSLICSDCQPIKFQGEIKQ